MSDTPRTDAMRLKMAQLGWPSDGEPVAMLMASHEKLERELADSRAWSSKLADVADDLRAELAAERALADRLAETMANVQGDYASTGAIVLPEVDTAIALWKEARRGTR